MRLAPLLHLAEGQPPSQLARHRRSLQVLMALLLVLRQLPAVLALLAALGFADACQLAGWIVA